MPGVQIQMPLSARLSGSRLRSMPDVRDSPSIMVGTTPQSLSGAIAVALRSTGVFGARAALGQHVGDGDRLDDRRFAGQSVLEVNDAVREDLDRLAAIAAVGRAPGDEVAELVGRQA